MIVEIGTSDFRTRAGLEDGLFVEPVKPYFDRLPRCRKENVAVSNRRGTVFVYYLEPDKIKELKLPDWSRGCNCINKPHPTIQKLLFNRVGSEWEEHITKEEVNVVRIKDLLIKHKIKEIDILKIDTEGHDCIILNDYLDTVSIKPKQIVFEANQLTPISDVSKMTRRLNTFGYNVRRYKTDIIAMQ